MAKFILIETKEVDGEGRKEESYTYRSEDGTQRVQFRAHSRKAFVYLMLESTNMSQTEFSSLIHAFTRAGLNQHKFAGGYEEAIATLNVK